MLVPGQINGHIVKGMGIAKFDTCPGTSKRSYCKGCVNSRIKFDTCPRTSK